MSFGAKVESIQSLKQSLAKAAATHDDVWIKYIPKDNPLTVRFLSEPDEWVRYDEAWDQHARNGKGGSYPVPMGKVVPDDQRVSTRYLASAVDLDSDRVIPVCIPKSLMQQVVVRYEKYGTIVDRDYELSRHGTGLDTQYMMDPEPPVARNLSKYDSLDLESVLAAAYADYTGEAAPSQAPAAEEVDDVPVLPDIEDGDDDEDDDDEELTKDDLAAMPMATLRTLARAQKIDPRGMSKAELIAAITGEDAF